MDNYHKFIVKSKHKSIDKELVSTLNTLKDKLYKALLTLISEEEKRDEVVQALIDSTLYIKYLEDNHIINSHFYGHYFNNAELNYEKLLINNSIEDLNILFERIHAIFNNNLFITPIIENAFLTNEVCNLIATSFRAD